MHPIAKLAMLGNLPPEMEKEFERIVDFAGGLAQAKGQEEPRLSPLRRDEPQPGLTLEQALSNAPSVAGEMITVPKTVGD